MSKKALCTPGILKIGQVKPLSLLMKSLCTEPHTCSFNYHSETGKEIPTVLLQPADTQVKQMQQCDAVTLHCEQGWYHSAFNELFAWSHLYADHFRKFLLFDNAWRGNAFFIFFFVYLFIYAFMHGWVFVFISMPIVYLLFLHWNMFETVRHTLDWNDAVVQFVSRIHSESSFCCGTLLV